VGERWREGALRTAIKISLYVVLGVLALTLLVFMLATCGTSVSSGAS
jgi:hypothetical protein